MSSSSYLPSSVLNPRRHVGIHAERVSDVSSTDYPGYYPDEDNSWNLENFKEVCGLEYPGALGKKLIL